MCFCLFMWTLNIFLTGSPSCSSQSWNHEVVCQVASRLASVLFCAIGICSAGFDSAHCLKAAFQSGAMAPQLHPVCAKASLAYFLICVYAFNSQIWFPAWLNIFQYKGKKDQNKTLKAYLDLRFLKLKHKFRFLRARESVKDSGRLDKGTERNFQWFPQWMLDGAKIDSIIHFWFAKGSSSFNRIN